MDTSMPKAATLELPKLSFKKVTVRQLDAPQAGAPTRFDAISDIGGGTGSVGLCCV